MGQSQIAMQTFNVLYTGMRSVSSGRGMSFTVKAFHDGSAVVNFIVTAKNATVELSACVNPVYDEKDKIVGYRVSNDDRTEKIKQLSEAFNIVRRMISEARSILSRV